MKTFSRSPAIGRGRKGLSTAPSFLAAQLYRLLPPAFPAHGERRDAVTSLVIVLFETSGDAGVVEKGFSGYRAVAVFHWAATRGDQHPRPLTRIGKRVPGLKRARHPNLETR